MQKQNRIILHSKKETSKNKNSRKDAHATQMQEQKIEVKFYLQRVSIMLI